MTETQTPTAQDEAGGRRNTKRITIAILAAVALIYLVLFVTRNGQDAEVDWVFGSTSGPLVYVIFTSVLLGLVIGAAGILVWQGRRRRRRG